MKDKQYFCYEPIVDNKELDLTIAETARFGKTKCNDSKIFQVEAVRKSLCKKKSPVKQSFYRLKPKVTSYKLQQKQLPTHKMSYSSRDQMISHKRLNINLNLEGILERQSSSNKMVSGEHSNDTKNSYRSRNYENLNSQKSSTSRVPWLSQSMISFKPKPGPKGKFKTAANAFKPPIGCPKPENGCTSTKKTRHVRMKSHFGVIPVFKHHKHGNSISTAAVTTNCFN